jgi:16S rRNA (guanine966-N2)-methyltransferase
MRVIAGQFKGRRLKTPTWDGLRPTSDKLRETIFNVLMARVSQARVFDGYAGTGAVGIEALSRGAAHVTFVDTNPRAAALIEENLKACGVTQGYTIQCADVVAALDALPAAAAFDLILLDPPYDTEHVSAALDAAARHLAGDGLLVLERATRREPGESPALMRVRDVTSGDSTLTLFRRRDSGSGTRDSNDTSPESRAPNPDGA